MFLFGFCVLAEGVLNLQFQNDNRINDTIVERKNKDLVKNLKIYCSNEKRGDPIAGFSIETPLFKKTH
ncbi:hypothetical protein QUF90_13190 [Desulfococcaceae bacterium HSG9]|nr:hypothetical protein [Desulfococcaceae bacterium HSG9]